MTRRDPDTHCRHLAATLIEIAAKSGYLEEDELESLLTCLVVDEAAVRTVIARIMAGYMEEILEESADSSDGKSIQVFCEMVEKVEIKALERMQGIQARENQALFAATQRPDQEKEMGVSEDEDNPHDAKIKDELEEAMRVYEQMRAFAGVDKMKDWVDVVCDSFWSIFEALKVCNFLINHGRNI